MIKIRVLEATAIVALLSCSEAAQTINGIEARVDGGTVRAVGSACVTDKDCDPDGSIRCIGDGFPGGYCSQIDCKTGGCSADSECYILASGVRACLAKCESNADCRQGYACTDNGACDVACAESSCGDGLTCTEGRCVADLTKHPAPRFPEPACDDAPDWRCRDGATECGTLYPFEPVDGPGYTNYPINGETLADQYRSFARKDTIMLVKSAAALVACKTKGWRMGNGQVLALGDMSEANGAIPGTRENDPGHPAGTHLNGFDMDIGYFQLKGADNQLRPICMHTENGKEAYHCTAAPNNLDLWRQSMVLGTMFATDRIRVIGVDGKVGALVTVAMKSLCKEGFLSNDSCKNEKLAYEETDGGAGWYLFHLHHFHISLNKYPAHGYPTEMLSIAPQRGSLRDRDMLMRSH